MALDALMVGAGEYTAGFVRSEDGEPASDKPAGVVALTFFDLRRQGKVKRLVLCDRDGEKMPAVRDTLRHKIGEVYADMDITLETFPDDTVSKKESAYLDAMDSMKRGDVVTIFTPDDTHFDIAKAAITRGLHVLVAKPLVKTREEHQQLVEEAKKHNVLVAVEFHKRFDPIYADAHDRIATLGPFSFFTSTMTQPKKQLRTFAAWAGKSSDISYYLNAHHIDFLCWSVGGDARPLWVSACASTGVADEELSRARARARARDEAKQQEHGGAHAGAGASASAGTEQVGRKEQEHVGADASAAAGVGAGTQRHSVEDTITLMVQWETRQGSRATSVHMASWISPPADCHTQQHWHYMGHKGELHADQAHRGFTGATDAKGYATLNPLYMKYTPDSAGRFAGQQGYGYRSIAEFVSAATQINDGLRTPASFTEEGVLATVDSLPVLYTTAILEAGRRSLDLGGAKVDVSV